jgi:hypothetical protein
MAAVTRKTLIRTAEWVGATAGQISSGIQKAASAVGIADDERTPSRPRAKRKAAARAGTQRQTRKRKPRASPRSGRKRTKA